MSPPHAAGFTLVEGVFAFAILVLAALTLTGALPSGQHLTRAARERSLASNAIRAYIEAMRQSYPSDPGSTDMAGFLYDKQTPADFVPTSGAEASALRDARGLVLKMTDETGARWGPAAVGTPP